MSTQVLEQIEVKVGQRWKANNPKARGFSIGTIVSIDDVEPAWAAVRDEQGKGHEVELQHFGARGKAGLMPVGSVESEPGPQDGPPPDLVPSDMATWAGRLAESERQRAAATNAVQRAVAESLERSILDGSPRWPGLPDGCATVEDAFAAVENLRRSVNDKIDEIVGLQAELRAYRLGPMMPTPNARQCQTIRIALDGHADALAKQAAKLYDLGQETAAVNVEAAGRDAKLLRERFDDQGSLALESTPIEKAIEETASTEA